MTARMKCALAGVVLILGTNAIALGGAWYNRSGEPDSVLALSERELALEGSWGHDEENSGLAVRLRVRATGRDDDTDFYSPYDTRLYDLEWLTAEKLAALGFDTSLPPDDANAARRYGRQLPRYAYLVLELDGPAYERTLKAVKRKFAESQREAVAKPDDKEVQGKLEVQRNWLEREEHDNTRLFVIDAGPDPAALREAYPDRLRYAIARSHVAVSVCAPKKKERLCGNIEGLEVASIHVPRALQGVLGDAREYYGKDDKVVTYTAQVAWGRRLEPWLQSAEPGAPRQAPSGTPALRSR